MIDILYHKWNIDGNAFFFHSHKQNGNDPSAEAKSFPKNNLESALKMATKAVGDVIRDEREARCRMGGGKGFSA